MKRTHPVADAMELFVDAESKSDGADESGAIRTETVHVAGRVMARRGMGRMSFLDIRDGSGEIQIQARKDVLSDDFELLSMLDIGRFRLGFRPGNPHAARADID